MLFSVLKSNSYLRVKYWPSIKQYCPFLPNIITCLHLNASPHIMLLLQNTDMYPAIRKTMSFFKSFYMLRKDSKTLQLRLKN